MQIAAQIDPFQHELQVLIYVMGGQTIARIGGDEQIFGETQLSGTEDMTGDGHQLGRAFDGHEGGVSLTADGQQERMNTRCIDGMHFLYPGYFIRYGVAGHLMDQLSETRVLLRRTTDDRERPDGILASINLVYPHQGEGMLQAVISEVIAERAFRFHFAGMDLTGDHKIGIRTHAETVAICVPEPASSQQPREGHLAESLRKRHHGGHGMGRWSSREDTYLQRLSETVGLGLMHADASVQLIVEAYLPILFIFMSRKLHPVHAKI